MGCFAFRLTTSWNATGAEPTRVKWRSRSNLMITFLRRPIPPSTCGAEGRLWPRAADFSIAAKWAAISDVLCQALRA
jgi:hypothetical protein